MKKGKLDNAKRRALNLFDDWNNVTGLVVEHTGYYYELQGLIEDAVECGVQAALGIYGPLKCERVFKEGLVGAAERVIVLGVGPEIVTYCVRCRAKRAIKDATEVTMKNGRSAVKGTCPICGTGMFRFLAEKKEVSDVSKKVHLAVGFIPEEGKDVLDS